MFLASGQYPALCLMVLLTLIFPEISWAGSTVFDDTDAVVELTGNVEYFEDIDSSQTIDSIQNLGEQFRLVEQVAANFGLTKSTYWFRLSLTNATSERLLLLEIGYPVLDYLTLYKRDADGAYKAIESGDMLYFKHRARPHRTFTFELPLQKSQTETYYIKVQTSGSVQLPLKVYSEKSFAITAASENSALGVYYGMILVMIAFHFLLWIILKDINYLYYIGFLFSKCAVLMLLNGNGHRYFFGELPWVGNLILPVFLFIVCATSIGFLQRFLEVKNYNLRLDSALKKLEFILWGMPLIAFIAPTYLMLKLAAFGVFVTIATLMTVAVMISLKGYRPAQIFLAAWTLMLVGVGIYLGKTVGLLPSIFLTEYAVLVGSALEVTLLSFALAYRIQILQKEKEAARASEEKAHHSLAENYQSLQREYRRRQEAEQALAVEFKARTHLVAEAAHRLNNPLNVSLGGICALENRLDLHGNLISQIFAEFADGSEDGRKVFERLMKDLMEMKETSSDSNTAMSRAAEYLRELRVIGGTEDEQNKFVTLDQIFCKSRERVDANLGPGTWDSIKLESDLPEKTVWSNAYVASSLLDYAIRELDSCSPDGITIHLLDSADGESDMSALSVLVSTGVGGERKAKGDLAGLNLLQLAKSIGGGSPTVEDLQSETRQGYAFIFELVPPISLVGLDEPVDVSEENREDSI